MQNPIFTPGTAERKKFLAELNGVAKYTGEVLHGDALTPGRLRQIRKYFHKTYKMLHRIAALENGIHANSFKHGYGGKILSRKVLMQLGVVEKDPQSLKQIQYRLCLPKEELDLELVSRVIVEVYLIRHEIDPL